MPEPAQTILSVRDLKVHFSVRDSHAMPWAAPRSLKAVDGISFDLRAGETALGVTGLVRHQSPARFRTTDQVESPSRELAKLTRGAYQKVSGSRQLGPHLDIDNDRSASFKNLIAGVRRMEQELLALPDVR